MEEFASVVKSYAEIGVLGLCAVVLITVFILLIKKLISANDTKQQNADKQTNELLTLVVEQNKELLEKTMQEKEKFVNEVIDGVVNHVPSYDENEKQSKINSNIDKCLQQMILDTNASRASLVQYHNGVKGVNKQSFLKMSMTNEQVQLGVKPMIADFKDQFRSVLAYCIKQLNINGYCYIEDVENMKTVDASLYEFLSSRGIQSKFLIAINSFEDDYVLGFLCVEFTDKTKIDLEKIKFCLQDYKHTIETLLNI